MQKIRAYLSKPLLYFLTCANNTGLPREGSMMMVVNVQCDIHNRRKNKRYSLLTKIFLTIRVKFKAGNNFPHETNCLDNTVKFILITIFLFAAGKDVKAQTLDSIFFNLYTDSLKKGTYNYINVEGHFTDGTFLPLGEKEVKFTASEGKFTGNSLFIDSSFAGDRITIKAVVIRNSRLAIETAVYIKTSPDDEKLPTMEEVMKSRKSDTIIRKKQRSNGRSI